MLKGLSGKFQHQVESRKCEFTKSIIRNWRKKQGLAGGMQYESMWHKNNCSHKVSRSPYSSPSQILDSAFKLKPFGQSQEKLPGRFWQKPPWQRRGSSRHSLISRKMKHANISKTRSLYKLQLNSAVLIALSVDGLSVVEMLSSVEGMLQSSN